jgi:cytochrome c553
MKTPAQFALLMVLAAVPFGAEGAQTGAPVAPASIDGCAACHGANGISVAANIPNLAAQKANYIRSQLTAFKEGKRDNDLMKAIASQLSESDIEGFAAYFASQPGAPNGEARSAELPQVAMGKIKIPDDYQSRFTVYQTTDFPAPRNQVRFHYVNQTALEAVRADRPLPDGSFIIVGTFSAALDAQGNPVKGPDGHFVPKEPVNFTAMAREAGWGESVPALLRDENWNFGSFRADRTPNTGSQAGCLACHGPQAKTSYLFTHKVLSEAAKRKD